MEQHLNPNPKPVSQSTMMDLTFVANKHVPRSFDESHASYYKATDKKHFGSKNEPGSKFLDKNLNKVEDVLVLRMKQTGTASLAGDDKEALIARGSDVNGFSESNRYLMVLTEGSVGITNSADVSPDTKVQVMQTKPGVPCSLVMSVEEQSRTDYAVVVVGKHNKTGNDFVITTFPGPVTKPTSNPELDAHEGETMTIAEVRGILGKDFWINTRVEG